MAWNIIFPVRKEKPELRCDGNRQSVDFAVRAGFANDFQEQSGKNSVGKLFIDCQDIVTDLVRNFANNQ